MNKNAGERIKKAREKKKWTQQDMANKLDISLRQYNKYESGKFPKYKKAVIEEIASILGVSSRELFLEQNVPRENENSLGEAVGDYGKPEPDFARELIAELRIQLQEARDRVKKHAPSETIQHINDIEAMLSGFVSEVKKQVDRMEDLLTTQFANLAADPSRANKSVGNSPAILQLTGNAKSSQPKKNTSNKK